MWYAGACSATLTNNILILGRMLSSMDMKKGSLSLHLEINEGVLKTRWFVLEQNFELRPLWAFFFLSLSDQSHRADRRYNTNKGSVEILPLLTLHKEWGQISGWWNELSMMSTAAQTLTWPRWIMGEMALLWLMPSHSNTSGQKVRNTSADCHHSAHK